MASTYTLKQRIILAIVPRIASIVALCLGATLRYEHVCEPGATVGFDVPAPAVYAFWHRCLLAGVWPFRNHGLTLLISQSFDGELIARTAEQMGFLSVRGSSSRDGAPGLRNLQRAYLAGHYCAVTADGYGATPSAVTPWSRMSSIICRIRPWAALRFFGSRTASTPSSPGSPGV